MSEVTGAIDLDAIYGGDTEATGNAIRLLSQAVSQGRGVLPVLTDKVIIPTFAESGLQIETEQGERIAQFGGLQAGSLGVVTGAPAQTFIDFMTQRRFRLGEVWDVGDTYALNDFDLGGTASGAHLPNEGFIRNIIRIAPSFEGKGFNGIYKAYPDTVSPVSEGHMVVVWNDSDFNVPVGTFKQSPSSAYNGIIGPPFALGPQGAAIFIHDTQWYDTRVSSFSSGWRPVAVMNPGFLSYTPTWEAAGGSPTIGTGGTIIGRYMRNGGLVYWEARVTWGTGFSFGTGNAGISLPFTVHAIGTGGNLFTAEALDVGSNAYRLNAVYAAIGSVPCCIPYLFASARDAITTTTPFTWVAGDSIAFSGVAKEAP